MDYQEATSVMKKNTRKAEKLGKNHNHQDYLTGLTMTEYQRQMLLNGQVVERVSTEQMELYRQLAGMGNNMNQLAHQANKYGYYKDAGMHHENAMQVSNLINQILHDGKDNKRA